jgi:1-piperideine-2-carboxylate/1-pyrroline-2-carboxylate reductase [NAD(P)H]
LNIGTPASGLEPEERRFIRPNRAHVRCGGVGRRIRVEAVLWPAITADRAHWRLDFTFKFVRIAPTMTTALPVLDAAHTAAALPWDQLLPALSDMLLRKHRGETLAPERLAVPLKGGILLAMPATDGTFASTKLVTVHAGNPARGLPSILGEVLLMRADTGERVLMLDGPTVTGRRTAALSALAARSLLPDPYATARGSMLIVGAGVQGRAHLEAFAAVLGVRDVQVAARSALSAESLAAHGRSLGLDARACTDPDAALAAASIIVTATTSLSPLFADRVRADAFVAAVGAYRPEMCELPASLVRRASVYVDDLDGARHEAGDLLQAGLPWERVTALERVVAGEVRMPSHGPIVFKSVGQALWDLAAARLAYESCPRADDARNPVPGARR